MTNTYEGNPEMAFVAFPDGIDWLNVPAPLSADALRGKIILLDFWTYGCINCIHMIPVLKRIEAKYPDEVVVIGVHSAKFANEGTTENVRQIIQRYDLHHPVINDPEFTLWQAFRVQAWPTFAIIDPRGNLLAMQGGEIPFEGFDELFENMIAHFDALDEIDREPLEYQLEGHGMPENILRYPGKVLVDGPGGRLFIADTNHHRIIVCDLTTYTVQHVIGSGVRGYADGPLSTAQFHTPQGMALKDDKLYIADTNNHTIRFVDFDTNTVDTLAGTGVMNDSLVSVAAVIREPRAFNLRSPWDVAAGAGDTLFIAMAGAHQIWEVNLKTQELRVSAGNGRESLKNDTLTTSELAQPSGLYFHDGLLYFADSESSSIRVADYENDTVRTLAGPIENNLFRFGDADGQVGTSRLQHPLGITGDGTGTLYIADTYNNKIKQIDATTNTITLYGSQAGFADGDTRSARFYEPGGLDYHAGKLYVADTNNHAVRIIDLETRTVNTITFPNLDQLLSESRPTLLTAIPPTDTAPLRLPERAVSAGEATITLRLQLPEGYQRNPATISRIQWQGDDVITPFSDDTALTSLAMTIPAQLQEGQGLLQCTLALYYCQDTKQNLCYLEACTLEIPISVGPPGGVEQDVLQDILIEHHIKPPHLVDNTPIVKS